uniref:Uncharacterized protein n=1 Tax=Rhizophagus irregularis (strain DAOM 181602 / DAOM 197198 / MUCL 43194) TaxID=747089 RepID=U9UZT7_RHIID
MNIEFTGWSKDCVYFDISNSSIVNSTQSNVELAICTLLHSDCENSKIDIDGIGYSMGYILNKNNYRDLSNCLNIRSVTANYNQLNDLKLSAANNETLEYINLLDNSFSQNLNCFGRLVNLNVLLIGNTDEIRIEQGIYNRFYGSLKALKNLIKLENLSINDTDIDSGLEYLPDSIKIFQCSADKRPEAKVIRIFEQLKTYTMSSNDAFKGRYNLKAWKKNWKLIKENETLQNQIKQIEKLTLDAKLIELENENNKLYLEEKLTNLGQETNNLNQMVKELNAKLKQQEDVYRQTEQKIKEKEEKLDSLIAEKLVEKEKLEDEIKVLKDDLKIKEEDIKESEKQLEEKSKELKIKEDKTTNLENELNKIKLSLSKIEAKKNELGGLKKKLKHEGFFSKTSTSELRKKMDDLEKDIKLSQSKKEKLEAIAKTMEDEYEKIRKIKEALQDEQIEHRNNLKKLQKDKENLQRDLEKQKNNLKENEEIISNLRQKNEKKIIDTNNKMKEKEELIDELKQQNEKKITALNNEIKNKEENLREKEKFINELKQQNEKKITALNNEIKNKEEFIDKLNGEKKEISGLLSQIQTQQTEISELVNKIDKKHDLENVILTNDGHASEELEKIRRKLIEKHELTEEEIRDILYKQEEKIKLETQLKSLIN